MCGRVKRSANTGERIEKLLASVPDTRLHSLSRVDQTKLIVRQGQQTGRVAVYPTLLVRAPDNLHVLVRNKSLHLEECLLLLVDAGLCPLRGSTQRRSGPVGPCPFHLSWVTT